MYNFNKKQKIILGVLVAIVAGFICYYVYAKEDESSTTVRNVLSDNVETKKEEETGGYSDDRILVHVSGAVNKEGLVELKVDSRISDAIEKAGGVREDAYTEDINLAYKLEDGMKIKILTKQEKQQEKETESSLNTNNLEDLTKKHTTLSSGIYNDKESQQKTTTNKQESKVNINIATQAELETLPGIGPSTATKIISYRKEKGKFSNIEEIKEVSGIGEAKFQKIKEEICVK